MPPERADDPDQGALAAERLRLGAAFGSGGAAYARLRPAYPRELVDWLVGEPAALPVADVGAGTGKLTGLLLDLGHQVIAVDPSHDMLAQLRTAYPSARVRRGTGEATGLPDESVAAVCYAQSWHWVEPAAGTAEAARVLAPGGTLALIWNFLDDDDPGVAAVEAAMHALHVGAAPRDDSFADVGDPFGYEGRREATWSLPTTTADLAALVTTRSYYLARPENERAYLRRAVAEAVRAHYGPPGPTPIAVPYRTVAHRYRLPSTHPPALRCARPPDLARRREARWTRRAGRAAGTGPGGIGGVPMEESYVEVPGGRIAVQSYGGSGRDVLFIHGVGFCGPQWAYFAAAVRDRCRPFSLDLPGHAHSTAPMRTADDQWRHLSAAARGAGLDKPVLVAHDSAIWAAMVASLQDPAAFSALVLVGGTMVRLQQTMSLADDPQFVRDMSERFHLGHTGVGAEAAEAFRHELVEAAAADWMLADTRAGMYEEIGHSLVLGPDGTWMNTPSVATVLNAYRFDAASKMFPSTELYARLSVPTWFLRLDEGFDSNVDLGSAVFAEAPMVRIRTLYTGQYPQYTGVSELAEVLNEVLEST